MNAGILNEVIQLYRSVTVVNTYGERYETLELKYTTRANVSWDSGDRNDINDEIQYSYYKTFRIRSYVPIVETDTIVWQSKKYRINTLEYRRQANEIVVKAKLINE